MNLILLDVGGTYIRVAAGDDKSEVLWFFASATSELNVGKDRFLRQIKQILVTALERTNCHRADGGFNVLIGLPGHITPNSNVTFPPVFSDLQNFDLIWELREIVNPETISIENDAKARAWGEYVSLVNEQPEFEGTTLAVLSIGTGLGCGLICDSALLHGENNLAGEVGHMIMSPITPTSRLTALRVKDYCCGSGIPRLAISLAENQNLNRLLSIEESAQVTAEVICKRAIEGNPFAARVWDTFMELFSCLLFNLSCVVDPAAIIVAGGVASSSLFDVHKLERLTNGYRLGFLNRNSVRILPSRLGDRGVLYGLRSLHCLPPRATSEK